jgi:hypothetical protein
MAQDSGAAVVFFLSNNGKARKHSRCVGGQGRKKGGGSCVKCGVQRPIPLSEWLEKLSWADGTWFLSEQAEKLAPAVKICVNQGWTEHLSSEDAQAWFFDQLDLAALNVGHLTQPIVKELQKRFGQVVKREAFFSPAYRGILQDNILDCARRFSVELWKRGERPDITLRPGGKYYAYLHSLSVWVFEMRQEIKLEDLCEAVDTRYPDFSSQEKRLVFAFCLLREFSRRLNRHSGKLPGIPRLRQELILDFIRRAATSG